MAAAKKAKEEEKRKKQEEEVRSCAVARGQGKRVSVYRWPKGRPGTTAGVGPLLLHIRVVHAVRVLLLLRLVVLRFPFTHE